jgi:general stress protein YciG
MMNPSKSGFAAMSRDKQREIARQGGQAAHRKGTAHEFTVEEARAAGRKGGYTISRNRAHMALIGRKGAQRSVSRRHASARPDSELQLVESPSEEWA